MYQYYIYIFLFYIYCLFLDNISTEKSESLRNNFLFEHIYARILLHKREGEYLQNIYKKRKRWKMKNAFFFVKRMFLQPLFDVTHFVLRRIVYFVTSTSRAVAHWSNARDLRMRYKRARDIYISKERVEFIRCVKCKRGEFYVAFWHMYSRS